MQSHHHKFVRCHHGMSSQRYLRPTLQSKEIVVMIDRSQGSSLFLTSILFFLYHIIKGNVRLKLGVGAIFKKLKCFGVVYSLVFFSLFLVAWE